VVGLARCWGSEASDPSWFPGDGWGWLVFLVPGRGWSVRDVWAGGGVGLLFEIWIVDASTL
jgi:hypothetical protein